MAKVINYTPEQTAKMVADYKANPTAETVASIAAEMGKTVRSVVAKLSREGAYKAKEYVRKDGEKPVKKEELADKLMQLVGLSEGEADSLAKANRTALAKIIAKLEAVAE